MIGIQSDNGEQMDQKTSRSICNAVGERLQQSLRLQLMDPAPKLDRLVEELRRRERESSAHAPRGGGFRFFR